MRCRPWSLIGIVILVVVQPFCIVPSRAVRWGENIKEVRDELVVADAGAALHAIEIDDRRPARPFFALGRGRPLSGLLWLGEFVGVVFGYWSSNQFTVGAVIVAGVAIFLLGRGLRYLFANE